MWHVVSSEIPCFRLEAVMRQNSSRRYCVRFPDRMLIRAGVTAGFPYAGRRASSESPKYRWMLMAMAPKRDDEVCIGYKIKSLENGAAKYSGVKLIPLDD